MINRNGSVIKLVALHCIALPADCEPSKNIINYIHAEDSFLRNQQLLS
jgi:hypothetical protein